MVPTELQPAYILHQRRFAEQSLILELFTPHTGRLTVVAKGNRHRGLLQPFNPLLLAWRGRSSMPTLTQVEAAAPLHHLIGKTCFCGLYLNELLLRLTALQDPLPVVFTYYTHSLIALQQSDASNQQIEPILRYFECQLLQQLGLGLILTQDTNAQPLNPQGHYQYLIHQGPAPCQASPTSLHGSTLLALAAEDDLQPTQQREARQLMRQVLQHYLNGQPLKSRDFFNAVYNST